MNSGPPAAEVIGEVEALHTGAALDVFVADVHAEVQVAASVLAAMETRDPDAAL
jgi:hypothetical protein